VSFGLQGQLLITVRSGTATWAGRFRLDVALRHDREDTERRPRRPRQHLRSRLSTTSR
jgi:hypothetical protein